MNDAPRWRYDVAVLLVGTGTAWNAGNVGPVVGDLAAEFGFSLTTIGLLSGTLVFASMVAGIVVAPRVAERIGVVNGMRLACLMCAAGNVIFIVGPGFGGLAAGRVLAGAGLGFAGVLGPVFGRATGGVRRVGIFGAAFQLGIATGLGVGAVLNDVGAGWRVGFAVSAAAGLSALPFLRGVAGEVSLARGGKGFLRAAIRSPEVFRLGLLFTAMFAVPLTLGAWLVHYLSEADGLGTAMAGGLGFLMFGASALLRSVGATLSDRGVPAALLAGAAPWAATAGLVAIAVHPSLGVALPAVIAMAAGFALPYAVMMVSAQRLFPPEPADPVALLTMLGTAVAIAAIPLVGAALSGGHGEEALLALAAFVALAGLANLRSSDRPIAGDYRSVT
jgi:hypothetical protein